MATYRVAGYRPELTASLVTSTLGLAATDSWEIGERDGEAGAQSQWNLASCPRPETGVELSVQIERILIQLLPCADALWQLAKDGYQPDWFCYVGSHATEHAAELPRSVLQQVMQLPGHVLLDVFDDDWSGLT